MVYPCPVYSDPAFPKGEDSEKGTCLFLCFNVFSSPHSMNYDVLCIVLTMVKYTSILHINIQHTKHLKNS